MTPIALSVLSAPVTGAGPDAGASSAHPGLSDEFQGLVTLALWQLLQNNGSEKPSENIGSTMVKPDGKAPGKTGQKKSAGENDAPIIPAASPGTIIGTQPPQVVPVPILACPVSVVPDIGATTSQTNLPSPLNISTTPAEVKTGPAPSQPTPTTTPRGNGPTKTDDAPVIETMASPAEPILGVPIPGAAILRDPPSPGVTAFHLPETGTAGHPVPVLTPSDATINVPENPAGAKASVPAPETNGMGVAQQEMYVKKSENTTEVARQNDPTEKVLPVPATSIPIQKNLPVQFSVPVHAAPPIRDAGTDIPRDVSAETQPAATIAGHGAIDPQAGKTAPVDPVIPAPIAEIRPRAIERTHTLVALHAIQLRDSSVESLRVVIKPDAGTQLSLELRQRGDAIEARAILQQGDFADLKQQWPELQQRLEQRGIKLSPLAGENAGNHENPSFQQSSDPSTRREPQDDAGPRTISTSKTANRAPSQQPSHHHLETWA